VDSIQIPQNTGRVVTLKLYLAGTKTAATGRTLAVTISKAGGAFTNPNVGATNATEISDGWYKVTLATTDTNTLGDLVVRGTAAGCDDSERVLGVVKATNGGLTALPDTTIATNDSLVTIESLSASSIWAYGDRTLTSAPTLDATAVTAACAAALPAVNDVIETVFNAPVVNLTSTERLTDQNGAPLTALTVHQLLTSLFVNMLGDRAGVGTTRIAATLPGFGDCTVTATRISSTVIQATLIVPAAPPA